MRVSVDVLFSNLFLLGVKEISSHTHKKRLWYQLGVLVNVSNVHPYPLYMAVPQGQASLTGARHCGFECHHGVF